MVALANTTGEEECDEGMANSDEPDASCRTDCTLRRCGDGIIDPTAAAAFPEECEVDADCAPSEVCAACQCETGVALGDVAFTIAPPLPMAITTGVSRTSIVNGLVIGNVAVTMSGQPFDCSSWVADSGASIGWPNYTLDVPIPILGIQDVAQVLRLNDD